MRPQIYQRWLLPWPSGSGAGGASSSGQAPYQVLRRLRLAQNLLGGLADLPPMPALQELHLQVSACASHARVVTAECGLISAVCALFFAGGAAY